MGISSLRVQSYIISKYVYSDTYSELSTASATSHFQVRMERFTPSEEETAILVASPTKVTNLDALDAASRDEHQQAMNKKQQSSGVSIPSMYTGVSSQRSLSSSSSGADSLLSNISSENSYSSGSRSSTNATSDEIIGEDEEDEYTSSETDDEKSSSGHTVTRTPSAVDKRVKTNIVLTRSLSSSLADDSVNNSNKVSERALDLVQKGGMLCIYRRETNEMMV